MCQKWFLPDVEAEGLEVMGGDVPGANGLPLDAITRRETQQVHAKANQQQQQQPKKIASQQTAGNSTRHVGPSTERMRRPDTIAHAQLDVKRQCEHFELSAINYAQRY